MPVTVAQSLKPSTDPNLLQLTAVAVMPVAQSLKPSTDPWPNLLQLTVAVMPVAQSLKPLAVMPPALEVAVPSAAY